MTSYRGYRFPSEVISHAVWLYHRFSLSFRDVEDLLAERGINVTYETIRQWCRTFGLEYARRLRRRQGDTWYLDELFVRMQGRTQYLWRAVDEDGDVIDILVQPRRNRRAAIRFFRKLLKTQGAIPRCLITDKLPSYQAACRTLSPSGPALHSPVCEQSRRSVSSTDPPPRAPDARLQIDRAPPTLRVGPRRRPESLSRRPAPPTSRSSPRAPHPSVRRMERGDVCFVSSRPSSDLGRRPGPVSGKLTKPRRERGRGTRGHARRHIEILHLPSPRWPGCRYPPRQPSGRRQHATI